MGNWSVNAEMEEELVGDETVLRHTRRGRKATHSRGQYKGRTHEDQPLWSGPKTSRHDTRYLSTRSYLT